jgi:ABC-type transport system involved in multi-copper enzyme maturation permease subunit
MRELRAASRRRQTYWLRTGATLTVILLGTWLFVVMQYEHRKLSSYLFGTLTGSVIFYALLTGIRATADCLSEERREGTLGLLFLTGLKGYEVVLGKLAANSATTFYCVMAVLPVLGVPLLMGGLTVGEFGRMALVALNSLFFSLSLGLCVSAVNVSGRKAMLMTLILILVLTALLPACAVVSARLAKIPWLQTALLLPSTGFSYYMAWERQYRVRGQLFWYSLALVHGLAWGCLVLASIVAPRIWQYKLVGGRTLLWRECWQLWTFGSQAERKAFRSRLLSRNAFFWLASRARFKPGLVWIFLILIACAWMWGSAKQHRDWLNDTAYVVTALILNWTFKVWVAAEATGRLAQERKAGTLELLLSTPLSVRDILQGQRLALMRQFMGPLLAVLLLEALFMVAAISEPSTTNHFWGLFWIGSMLMLVADLTALYWVGMWQGLTSKSVSRATTSTLARILLFPWVACAVCVLVLVLASLGGDSWLGPKPEFYLAFWLAAGLLADLWFAGFARNKLRSDFRLAAQQNIIKGL